MYKKIVVEICVNCIFYANYVFNSKYIYFFQILNFLLSNICKNRGRKNIAEILLFRRGSSTQFVCAKESFRYLEEKVQLSLQTST